MALTLEEFLPKARQLNPDYTDDELIQAYQDRYRKPPTQTVSPAPLMTLEEFLPKARTLNPDYSDDELTQAWQEKYGARGAKENDPGFGGTFLEGAKSTGRSLKAAAQTATGNLSGVEETANVEAEKDPALQKLLADIQVRKNALGKDPSWWQSLKAVGGAVADNPKGAAMLAVEQLPNSAVALGSAGAGALAGSALGPAGTIAGGIAGLFIGNTAIETGAKALEKAGDGFTPEERTETLKEGAIKGGVVTGFDAATFGLTKWLTGTVARAMERATINVLQREGIDTTNKAAVQAARQNPELVAKVQQAQETARAATNTLGKKLARGAGEVGSEAIGEGAGEYIGEVAATGKGDKVEAVIEALSGLGQSGAEIAVAQGMSRKQQQQGAFGDVTGQPIVTERTPEDMGLGRATDQPPPGPLALEGPPQPGELRKGTVYAPGEVVDVSPTAVVDPSRVLNATDLDSAIAGALGIVQAPTEAAKARAAQFARMTAKAKNETDALLANAQPKRAGTAIPEITGYEPPPPKIGSIENPSKAWMQEGMVELPTLAGPALTPRPEPIDDPRARLAEERARMVAQREQQRMQHPVNPVSEPVAPAQSVEPADTPLPSQVDLAYPSSKQVRDLIHEKGFHLDTPVFREYLKMAVGKEKFSDLTPQELQTLAEKVQKIKAPQQPTPTQEAPPQVPLTPTEPKERAYAPVTTIPEAQVPRSELTPEKNAEMLLRAEKAKADLEIAGTERGGRFFQEQQGAGSTQEVTGLKSATADWYKELTSGPSPAIRGDRKRSAREKIEAAIAKIIKDQGADRGKAVEQVKAALLADTEFHKTEWGRDLNSIMQGEWPSWIEKPQGVTQATENAQEFQNVPRGTPQEEVEVPKAKKVPLSRTERLAQQKQKMEEKQADQAPTSSKAAPDVLYHGTHRDFDVFDRMQEAKNRVGLKLDTIGSWFSTSEKSAKAYGPKIVKANVSIKNPVLMTGDGKQGAIKALRAAVEREGGVEEFRRKAIAEGYDGIHIADDNVDKLEGDVWIAFDYKQIKRIGAEPSPSNAPAMETQPATASPERAPASSTSETAPKQEEPFSLSAPEVSKPKAKDAGPEQLGIEIPPETIGSRPIIGREATLEEAPLFSKNAQTPDAEQTAIPEESAQSIAPDITPAQSNPAQSPETAQSPTEIIAEALRTAADKIAGGQSSTQSPLPKQSRQKANEKVTRDGGLASNQQVVSPDPDPNEAEAVQKAVEGKTVLQAIRFVASSAPSAAHRLIAEKAEAQIKRLQMAGMKFELHVAHDGDRVPSALVRTRGMTWLPPKSLTTQVWIQGADVKGYVGTSHETVLHEVIHAATQAAIHIGSQPGQEDTALGKSVKDLHAVANAIRRHLNKRIKEADGDTTKLNAVERELLPHRENPLNPFNDPGEVIAWGFSNPRIQEYLEGIPYQTQTMWQSFVGAVRKFLGLPERNDTALSEVLRVGDEILNAHSTQLMTWMGMHWMPTQVNQHTGLLNSQQPLQDSARAESDTEKPTGTIDPTDARDRLAAVKTSVRPYLLGALGLEQLSQVYGNDHAEVKAYNQATQAMEADFTEMSRESDKVARAWTDLKIPVADKMAHVMEDARFLNFDPDPRKNQEADSAKKQALVTRFQQLPDDAKAVYRMARDYYTNMAEQRFQALKERIERAGGTPENTRKLVDRLQLAYEKVRSKVYFPFSRFGENIVVAKQMKDGKEVDREVHAFESVAEAQKFATMMKLKGWQVKQTIAREYSVDKEGPASKIVRQMHDIIKELGQGQQGLPGVLNLEDQLLDSLNQSFLQALPDMSYAKHFIHAKDVKGASKDALRAFAHSALHGSHHISRIRHADKVTKALMDLDQNINETGEGDTTEARQVYNELVKRHNDIMNPNTHPFSAWLGQLGFTMSLGGVVATGITNATQVPLVTYPWMGARYGFGKASAALARAYRDFLDPRTLNKDSLFDATKSKLISESERKMLLELARRGHIDLTQTMDLAGLSSRDNLSRKARTLGTVGEKVTRMLGFTFHVPEVMNRQVTALSTFRLEKEKGGSFEEALERAQQAIIDTHFLYQSFNRARYMQGNFLRVLTQFKQYSQNIAFTYGRAASIWLDKNGATKEERAVAKRQLLSMLALQFGAAGALGMPFFGAPLDLLMAVVSAMGDDDDEKRDWEVSLRKWLDGTATSLAEAFIDDKEQAGKVGKELAEVVAHGASRLTPWDMAGRLGQNDLFFREPQREREGRQAVMDWMLSLGGPVPGYGVNFLLGLGDVAKGMTELNAGFFMRGVEELTPAVLRNGVKSLRYTLEGVRTRDEYKQLDLDTSEKLGQLFGFTPARVAEMYESITAVKNKEHRILNEQKALKDRFARAVDDQDDKAKQRILEDIRGFNERNPMFGITSDTLNQSLKARRQHEAGMERGMYLPPRRRALLEEGDWADF